VVLEAERICRIDLSFPFGDKVDDDAFRVKWWWAMAL
jgi:hypothetical protein